MDFDQIAKMPSTKVIKRKSRFSKESERTEKYKITYGL